MTEIILHVGPHKTASTYIQRALLADAPALVGLGVGVPVGWSDSAPNPSHTGLIARLTDGQHAGLAAQFAAWRTQGMARAVISCEGAVDLPEATLSALRGLAEPWRVRVVFYVRAWPGKLASAWNEDVVHGKTMTMPEYIARALRKPFGSRALHYQMDLGKFETVFGLDQISLVCFESVLESGEDFYAHFARQFLGLAGRRAEAGGIANPSFMPAQAELVRICNVMDAQAGRARGAVLAQAIRARMAAPEIASILPRLAAHGRSIELDTHARPLGNVMLQNFHRYGGCAVPPHPPGAFHGRKIVKLVYISSDYMADTALAREVAAVYRWLCAELEEG